MFWLLHCIDTLLYILYSEYMLLALLYVLGTYVFISLLLYSMNKESPPETVDKDVNNSIAVKGLKDDGNKSNSITISRTHTEHGKTD